jgi:translation initiation factor 5B
VGKKKNNKAGGAGDDYYSSGAFEADQMAAELAMNASSAPRASASGAAAAAAAERDDDDNDDDRNDQNNDNDDDNEVEETDKKKASSDDVSETKKKKGGQNGAQSNANNSAATTTTTTAAAATAANKKALTAAEEKAALALARLQLGANGKAEIDAKYKVKESKKKDAKDDAASTAPTGAAAAAAAEAPAAPLDPKKLLEEKAAAARAAAEAAVDVKFAEQLKAFEDIDARSSDDDATGAAGQGEFEEDGDGAKKDDDDGVKDAWDDSSSEEDAKPVVSSAEAKKLALAAAKAAKEERRRKRAALRDLLQLIAKQRAADGTAAAAAVMREAREAEKEVEDAVDTEALRSPICCVLGHVDTGKTKLLDRIRRTNVQGGEAGGITQQIGATYFPLTTLQEQTARLQKDGKTADIRVPGLLVIDTPGHESFTNLRSRGSSLCDMAILVVDLMHGLEPQTIESIKLLRQKKTPFVVALNKVDRCVDWKPVDGQPIRDSLKRQSRPAMQQFEEHTKMIIAQFAAEEINVELYWKNKDIRKYVSMVPTSAISGEGVPDLLVLMIQLLQKMMTTKLQQRNELNCTVLEVKVIEGLGTTIDVVLVDGVLHEGDTIVVCGLAGPIVTQVRALLTPQPGKELRVKGTYVHHKKLRGAVGVKIAANDLEGAIAGSQLFVAHPGDDIEKLKEEVMGEVTSMLNQVDHTGRGVCVQASTLGSLEALLQFLRDSKIPVNGVNIGPVHRKDVMKASIMLERERELAVLLCFDVKVTPEARTEADKIGVRIFEANIIYNLFDMFTAYMKAEREKKRAAASDTAVFPAVIKVLKCFNKSDPLVLGCEVTEGALRVGTPLCLSAKTDIELGRVASLERDHKAITVANLGDQVAVKIVPQNPQQASRMHGRHFNDDDVLVSVISRASIDALKEHFKDDITLEDKNLLVKLKTLFKIAK